MRDGEEILGNQKGFSSEVIIRLLLARQPLFYTTLS